jgi:hypothetical protein
MKKKLRPLGKITEDMEVLLTEMTTDHELQIHEVLGLVYSYLLAHCPSSIENYTDNTKPIYYYGHQDVFKK